MQASSPQYKKARRHHFKTTQRNSSPDWSPFRAAEKRYKARFPPPDLSHVLDLATLDPARAHEIQQGFWSGRSDLIAHKPIVIPDRDTRAYIVPCIPGSTFFGPFCMFSSPYRISTGLVVLPAFIQPDQQRDLVRWSLADHARYPNETNLDAHYQIPQEGLWNAWLNSQNDPEKDILIQPKASETDVAPAEPPGPRKLIDNTPASLTNFRSLSSTPKSPQVPSATVRPNLTSKLLPKLRWANIGWFYHWGTKQYDFTKGRGTIDDRVRDVCRDAVRAVDWEQVYVVVKTSWENTDPDWKSWNNTYGNISRLAWSPLTSSWRRT